MNYALATLLLVALIINVWLYYDFRKERRELLDRLMARDFGEYKIFQTEKLVHKKREPMTDAKEAELERRRKEAVGG